MKRQNKIDLHGQGSSTPPVIVKWSFYDKNHSKRKWMTNNSISLKSQGNKKRRYKNNLEYCGRKTEAIIIKSARTAGYLQYQNQEYKVTSSGHFTSDGIYTNAEMKEVVRNNPKYKVPNKSLVWSGVVSFSKEFFERHHIVSKEDAHEVIKNTIDSFFEDNHLDPNAMTWVGQFHVDTPHHFHVHLRVHENKPSHFNRKTKKDEWRNKGKWSKKSSYNFRKSIEEYSVARTARREKVFSIIGKRDMLKYEVLGTLKDSKDYLSFSKEARMIKSLLPKKGRLQYNSKNIDAPLKMKIERLTNLILDSNTKIKTTWKELNQKIDNPVDKMIKGYNSKTRYGKNMIKACELLRVNKKNEIFGNVANQVMKFIKGNDWKDKKTLKGVNEFNKANKQKYTSAAFNKSKTKAFKFFSADRFLRNLEFKENQSIEKDVQEGLLAISRDLAENIRKAKGVKYE